MGKSIFDLIGDGLGQVGNNIGSFLNTAGQDIGKGVNQFFTNPNQAPIQAPPQSTQAPAQAPITAPMGVMPMGMQTLGIPANSVPLPVAPPPAPAKKNKPSPLATVDPATASPLRQGELNAFNDLATQYNKVSANPQTAQQFMNDINKIATQGSGDYQIAAKDIQSKLSPSPLQQIGQAIIGNSGFDSIKTLGQGVGTALAYNTNPTVQQAVSTDPNFAQSVANATNPQAIIPAAIGTGMAAASGGIGEGLGNTITGLLARDTVLPTLARAAGGAAIGGGVAAGVTAGGEALGSGIATGKVTVNPNDVVNSIIPGAVGGFLLSGVRPTKQESVAHQTLIETNPNYRATNDRLTQLQAQKQAAQAAGASPKTIAPIDKAITAAANSMQAMRQRFGERGSIGNAGEPEHANADDELAKQTVASTTNHKDIEKEMVDYLWENNKKGLGIEGHTYDSGELGVGSSTNRAFIESHNNPFYRSFYAEYGHAPTRTKIKELVNDYFEHGQDNMVGHEFGMGDLRDVYNQVKERNEAQDRLAATGKPPEPDTHTLKINTINGKAYKTTPYNQRREDYYNSPEYKVKSEAGQKVSILKDEYRQAKLASEAHDKQINGLKRKGQATAAIEQYDPTLKLKAYEAKAQLDAAAKQLDTHADALHAKFPDVNVDGRQKARLRQQKMTVKQKQALDAEQEQYLKQPDNKYTLGKDEPVKTVKVTSKKTTPTEVKPPVQQKSEQLSVTNEKKSASNSEDMKNALGLTDDAIKKSRDKQAEVAPEIAVPKPEKQARKEGETAAFISLKDGSTMEEAAHAYEKAHGDVTYEQALAETNKVATRGVGLETKESVISKNPQAHTFDEPNKITSMRDISTLARSHRDLFNQHEKELTKQASKLSENDMSLLHDVRGQSIDDFIKAHDDELDNPTAVKRYLEYQKSANDDLHEYDRINGGMAGYRENRGAGLYTKDPNIVDDKGSREPLITSLNSDFGTSKARHNDNYADIEKSTGRVAKNETYHEDALSDLHQANIIRQKEIHRLLEDAHGSDQVSYGTKTSVADTQLNNAKNVFATKEIADQWNALNPQHVYHGPVVEAVSKVYDAINSAIVQATVYNPLIHTGNLIAQFIEGAGSVNKFGLSGLAKSFHSTAELLSDKDLAAAWTNDYLKHGGHLETFGKSGFVSKMTHGVSDINKHFLEHVETIGRVGLYKAYIEAGHEPLEAVRRIDDFMGSDKPMNQVIQKVGFFAKFFRTTTNSIAQMVGHPVKNFGAIQNTVLLAGTLYALNYGFQQFTGNKNAYLRMPGNLGLIKELVNGVIGAYEGDGGKSLLQIITNRINPIIKETAQQVFDRDLFTGKTLEQSGGRGGHAATTFLTPVSQGSAVASGKKSLLEQGLNTGLGVYTPHATGNVATTNPSLSALNTPKATNAAGSDPTGYSQEKEFFKTTAQAKSTLDPTQQTLYDTETTTEKDNNGKPVPKNEGQAQSDALTLAADYKSSHQDPKNSHQSVLEAITAQKQDEAKKNGTPLDPLYKDKLSDGTVVTPAMRAEYELMKGSPYKGEEYTYIGDKNAWMKTLGTDRSTFFANNPIQGAGAAPSDRIKPPSFTPQVQADMSKASSLSGSEKAAFIAGNQGVQDAYAAISKYTNDVRNAQGYPQFKDYPTAPPDVRAAILAMGDVKNKTGSSSSWIKANPDEYKKVQNYFASTAEYNAANSFGQDRFVGNTASQTALKSAYDLGKYDIAKTVGANGVATYTIDPQAASAQNYKPRRGGGSGGGSGKLSNGFIKGLIRTQNKMKITKSRSAPHLRTYKSPRIANVGAPKRGSLTIRSQKLSI